MSVLSTMLHVHPHFNAEEAAHAAAEFVASSSHSSQFLDILIDGKYPLGLDNLPGEINFLLEEIKDKDARINRGFINYHLK